MIHALISPDRTIAKCGEVLTPGRHSAETSNGNVNCVRCLYFLRLDLLHQLNSHVQTMLHAPVNWYNSGDDRLSSVAHIYVHLIDLTDRISDAIREDDKT